MRIEALREGGPHAIETFCALAQDWRTGQFKKSSCVVVYGDKDQLTHSVRMFTWPKEQQP